MRYVKDPLAIKQPWSLSSPLKTTCKILFLGVLAPIILINKTI